MLTAGSTATTSTTSTTPGSRTSTTVLLLHTVLVTVGSAAASLEVKGVES